MRPDAVAMRFAEGPPAMLERERELVLRAATSRDGALERQLIDRSEQVLEEALRIRD